MAGLLFAAVLALRLAYGEPGDGYSMFFALPVALLAVTFGLRGGLVGALTAVVLMMVWVVHDEVHLGALSWGARVVPMTTFGLLLGHGADRLRQGEIRQREHEAAALLHQQAIEINESLVQGLAAARWALEAGRIDHGITLLDQTMTQAQEMVSDLIRRAGIGDRTTG